MHCTVLLCYNCTVSLLLSNNHFVRLIVVTTILRPRYYLCHCRYQPTSVIVTHSTTEVSLSFLLPIHLCHCHVSVHNLEVLLTQYKSTDVTAIHSITNLQVSLSLPLMHVYPIHWCHCHWYMYTQSTGVTVIATDACIPNQLVSLSLPLIHVYPIHWCHCHYHWYMYTQSTGVTVITPDTCMYPIHCHWCHCHA